MKVHMMGKHAEEKPHRCNQCNYAGVNTGALRAHMVIHTGEELFKCKRWEKPFGRSMDDATVARIMGLYLVIDGIHLSKQFGI